MSEMLDPDSMPNYLSHIFSSRKNDKRVIAGVNDDDCAVLPWGDSVMVASTDFVNANPIPIEFGIGDLLTVGRLAIAANLSDLLGTGATPKCILLSVMMPRESLTSDFQRIISGAKSEAEKWDVPISGGDTKLGKSLVVGATAIGEAASVDHLFLKYRARPGDNIWLSGPLGSCTAAVLGWENLGNDLAWKKWATEKLTIPNIPILKSQSLSKLGLCCSGTDISDGLGMDLAQLCETSDVGATIQVDSLPIIPQVEQAASTLRVPSWSLSFGIGGDFQFLVTAPPNVSQSLNRLIFHQIGSITSGNSRKCPNNC